jgi:hypothetical protein
MVLHILAGGGIESDAPSHQIEHQVTGRRPRCYVRRWLLGGLATQNFVQFHGVFSGSSSYLFSFRHSVSDFALSRLAQRFAPSFLMQTV